MAAAPAPALQAAPAFRLVNVAVVTATNLASLEAVWGEDAEGVEHPNIGLVVKLRGREQLAALHAMAAGANGLEGQVSSRMNAYPSRI